MPGPVAPSGNQYEITHGGQRVVVVEVGGGVRLYEIAGRPVLDGYELEQRCSGGRGQILIPWPNRLGDGQYEFGGERFQLPLSEPESGNAIHGLVRWASWEAAEHGPDRVVMRHLLHPQPGWPGTLALEVEYLLDDGGLSVQTVASNVGAVACPYGTGAHPYLTLETEAIDSLCLQVPARRCLESDERGLPVGHQEVKGTPLDFTEPRALGETRLDTAYTDLFRDEDGVARVGLSRADGSRSACLWVDEAYPYLMLFTGDTLPAGERRRALAIEPMSCAPNAFQSGQGLVRLEPGELHRGRWGVQVAP